MITMWVHPEYLLLKEKFEMWYDRTHPENWCLVRREYGHICGGRSLEEETQEAGQGDV